jgi:hypothetical protein
MNDVAFFDMADEQWGMGVMFLVIRPDFLFVAIRVAITA